MKSAHLRPSAPAAPWPSGRRKRPDARRALPPLEARDQESAGRGERVCGEFTPTPPRITFAIPAYNRPALLREALDSLMAQEGFDSFEVIVVDDLGLTQTEEMVRRYPAHRVALYRNGARLGAVENWNRCLALARTEWVSILHEDDRLYPWFTAQLAPRLRATIAAVCCRTVQGRAAPALPRPDPRGTRPARPGHFLKSGMTPFPGVLVNRRLALTLGGFDARWGGLADYEFWYRLACAGPVEVVQVVGAFYRVHDGQWTGEAWPQMLRAMHLLRLRIAREQFGGAAWARWMARFFTFRSALAYRRRFAGEPLVLKRTLGFEACPGMRLPSGFVWEALRLRARLNASPWEPVT